MHRDHWIPADDRTKVFWLFGCLAVPSSLKSHTCSRLFPIAYRLKPLACFGELDLDRVLRGLGVCTRKKTLVWGSDVGLHFHWMKEVSEQPID
jgi:hypothetical protein